MKITHEEIIRRLCNRGFATYVVGGSVRDMLAGVDPKDFDIVTAAAPEVVAVIFHDHDVRVVGKSFGVVLVDGTEVATFRHDRHSGVGDKHCAVSFVSSIQEDLSRRDFTVNAMACCELTGDIIDVHGGRVDLKQRVIRFVGDAGKRIKEDPNRIIRACRFLAKLEGDFDPQTREALQDHARYVRDYVAPERVRLEIMKAMDVAKPSLFFSALHSIDALRYIFPAMDSCAGHPHGQWHQEDVFTHLMLTGDALPAEAPLLRLAGYLHDIGKPAAWLEMGNGTFVGHELTGEDLVEAELKALKFSADEIRQVKGLVRLHMSVVRGASDKALRRLLRRMHEKGVSPAEFLALKAADHTANLLKSPAGLHELEALRLQFSKLAEEKPPVGAHALAVSGGELIKVFNLTPGPLVGKLQRHLLDQVVDQGSEINTKDSLLVLAKQFLQTEENHGV